MPKLPLSVTLEQDNLLWLRGRVAAGKRKSLSEALDEILTAARVGGQVANARSVVGTVDIAADDPGLERADEHVRAQFAASIARPALVREGRTQFGRAKSKSRRG